ncbi:unnamed protein product, partial [Phaeothamnion confervicola]
RPDEAAVAAAVRRDVGRWRRAEARLRRLEARRHGGFGGSGKSGAGGLVAGAAVDSSGEEEGDDNWGSNGGTEALLSHFVEELDAFEAAESAFLVDAAAALQGFAADYGTDALGPLAAYAGPFPGNGNDHDGGSYGTGAAATVAVAATRQVMTLSKAWPVLRALREALEDLEAERERLAAALRLASYASDADGVRPAVERLRAALLDASIGAAAGLTRTSSGVLKTAALAGTTVAVGAAAAATARESLSWRQKEDRRSSRGGGGGLSLDAQVLEAVRDDLDAVEKFLAAAAAKLS